MKYALLILTILGELLGALVLLLLVVLLFALAVPVRLRFSGSGSVRGLETLLEDGLDDAGPRVQSEGHFQGQASMLGGLILASVMGRPGGEKDSGASAGGIETQIRLLGVFTIGPRKSPGKRRDSFYRATDTTRPAGEKEGKLGRKRGRAPRIPSRKRLGGFSKVLEPFGTEDFRSEVIRALKALHRALHLKVRGKAHFGLGDPGATGMVYGIAQSFMGCLGITALTLTPNFDEDVLQGEASVEAWFIPLDVLFILVRTMLSAPVRPLWWKRKKTRRATAPSLPTVVKGHPS